MFNAVTDSALSCVYSPLELIEKKGLSHYIFEKLQERNPFQTSSEYQKEVKTLTKNLMILKGIKKQFRTQLIKQKNNKIQNKYQDLNQRIANLQYKLNYLEREELGLTLLKWATPCNLILPGSGDTIRTLSYTFKMANAINYYFQNHFQDKITAVGKEITISYSVSAITQVVYDTIQSLKKYLTYENFRSVFYY